MSGRKTRRNVWAAFALGAALLLGAPESFAEPPEISGSFLMGTGSATGNYYANYQIGRASCRERV